LLSLLHPHVLLLGYRLYSQFSLSSLVEHLALFDCDGDFQLRA